MLLRPWPVLLSALCGVGTSLSGMAQVEHGLHAKPAAKAASNATDTILSNGVVKKIDSAGMRLTIAHDRLPNGMPAMTMSFRLKDAALLERLQVEQAIRFATDRTDNMLVVYLELVK